MPYTGKPSGACLTCRNRRIKCDETKPFCQKCRASNRQCLGYKDPSQVKFRDMTAMTIKRYKNIPAETGHPYTDPYHNGAASMGNYPVPSVSPERTSDSAMVPAYGSLLSSASSLEAIHGQTTMTVTAKEEQKRRFRGKPSPAPLPAVSINQHSISYFFTVYLGAANHYLDTGFSGVLDILVRKGKPPRYLSAAISATSIAAFSRRPNARSLTPNAERTYTTALNEVNIALQEPDAIYNDDLLASIIILALYELLMSTKLTGYYNHILGAATMLKGRENGPINSAVAAMAFILTRNEIMKSSILAHLVSLEADTNPWMRWVHALGLNTWTSSAYNYMAPSKLSQPVMHFKALIYEAMEDSSVSTPTPPSMKVAHNATAITTSRQDNDSIDGSASPSDPESPPDFRSLDLRGFVLQLLQISNKFAKIDKTMSDLYHMGPARPQPVPDGVPREVGGWVLFPDTPIYIYDSTIHAGFRLAMALARLEPCSKAVGMISSMPGQGALQELEEFKEMEQIGKQAIDELVGSVPFWCGLLPISTVNSSSFDLAGIRDAQSISFGLWAMAAGIMSPYITTANREYLLQMLQYCHQVKGIGQAAALYAACMQSFRMSATTTQRWASSIPPSWMGRGTSLESIIYGTP